MEKRISVLVLVLIFVLILLVISIFFLIKSAEKNYAGNAIKNAVNEEYAEEDTGETDSITGGVVSESESGNNLGVVEGNGNQQPDKKNLPSDIESVECGFYFSEFGACAGTCPSGTCSSEGRSCYCKNE